VVISATRQQKNLPDLFEVRYYRRRSHSIETIGTQFCLVRIWSLLIGWGSLLRVLVHIRVLRDHNYFPSTASISDWFQMSRSSSHARISPWRCQQHESPHIPVFRRPQTKNAFRVDVHAMHQIPPAHEQLWKFGHRITVLLSCSAARQYQRTVSRC